jgi:hypothetical protein
MAAASLCAPDSDALAARAIVLLRQATVKDFNEVMKFSREPDLEPLRRRADFIDLLWDLADAPPVKK